MIEATDNMCVCWCSWYKQVELGEFNFGNVHWIDLILKGRQFNTDKGDTIVVDYIMTDLDIDQSEEIVNGQIDVADGKCVLIVCVAWNIMMP